MNGKDSLFVNIGKGTPEIKISRFMNQQGIVVLSLQQGHAKGIAQPVAGLADPNRRGYGTRNVGFGEHPNAPAM
jgi:hypothetical protein